MYLFQQTRQQHRCWRTTSFVQYILQSRWKLPSGTMALHHARQWIVKRVHLPSLIIIIIITSGQRMLTKGRIAWADFSRGKSNVAPTRLPVGSIAVGCSSRAVMLLLRTEWSLYSIRCSVDSQSQFFLMGQKNPKIAPSRRRSRFPSNTWFLGPAWVSPQTTSRSVRPFLHRSPVCPTHRHMDSRVNTHEGVLILLVLWFTY